MWHTCLIEWQPHVSRHAVGNRHMSDHAACLAASTKKASSVLGQSPRQVRRQDPTHTCNVHTSRACLNQQLVSLLNGMSSAHYTTRDVRTWQEFELINNTVYSIKWPLGVLLLIVYPDLNAFLHRPAYLCVFRPILNPAHAGFLSGHEWGGPEQPADCNFPAGNARFPPPIIMLADDVFEIFLGKKNG